MSADPVNLNRFRKQKARAEREAEAAANRALFGRTKAEKLEAKREAEIESRRLDGHRRDPDTRDGER